MTLQRKEADVLTEKLESLEPKGREAAVRLRRLAVALFARDQDPNRPTSLYGLQTKLAVALAEVTASEKKPIVRTEVNTAWNGGNLFTTARWVEPLAKLANVGADGMGRYLRGEIELEELLAPVQPMIQPEHMERAFRIGALLKRSAEDAMAVAEGLRGYHGELTDEMIVQRFGAKTPPSGIIVRDTGGSPRDDLGTGTKGGGPRKRRK